MGEGAGVSVGGVTTAEAVATAVGVDSGMAAGNGVGKASSQADRPSKSTSQIIVRCNLRMA